MTAPTLREAREEDAPVLDALARALGLALDTRAELARPHAELWVLAASEPVGFALGWLVADELEVVDVGVAEEHRGQGHGVRLVERLLERGRAGGAVRAFLEVRASNHGARRTYEKCGFARVGERRGYYADGEDAWLFRAELGRV